MKFSKRSNWHICMLVKIRVNVCSCVHIQYQSKARVIETLRSPDILNFDGRILPLYSKIDRSYTKDRSGSICGTGHRLLLVHTVG